LFFQCDWPIHIEGAPTICSPRSTLYCNSLQHTATHCNTLQHTATHCNTRAYHLLSSLDFVLPLTATHCNTPLSQLAITHQNTLQQLQFIFFFLNFFFKKMNRQCISGAPTSCSQRWTLCLSSNHSILSCKFVFSLHIVCAYSYVCVCSCKYIWMQVHLLDWVYPQVPRYYRVSSFIYLHRPTQSIMYVPLEVNRSQKGVLLIVQDKYIKSCSGDFYSPESDPPHKIMRYLVYYSTQLCFGFPPDRICQAQMICTGGVPVLKRHFGGAGPWIFYMIHRGGRCSLHLLIYMCVFVQLYMIFMRVLDFVFILRSLDPIV